MELPPVESPLFRIRMLQIGAALAGPIVCWLPLLLFCFVSLFWGEFWPPQLFFRVATGFFLLAYFPVSALICGFCSSYFLCRAFPHHETLRSGCWTQNLFLLPFLIHPLMWCLILIIAPLHAWLYGIAFTSGVAFWNSERPRQWLGDF